MRRLLLLTILVLFSAYSAHAQATVILSPNTDQVGNNANSPQPATLPFGSQATGVASVAQTITVNNCAPVLNPSNVQINPAACSGSGSLTLSNTTYAAITGTNAADFSITGGTCANGSVVATNSFCTINIVFTPSASAGTSETATLTVNDNAANGNPTISLKGTSASASAVTSCGTLGTANTVYSLQNNISATGTCLTVTANNVTVDLKGFTITYDTGATASVYGITAGSGVTGLHITSSVAGGTITESTACQVSVVTQPNTSGKCGTANPIQVVYGWVDHLTLFDYGLDNQSIQVGNNNASFALIHDNTICPYHTLSSLTHFANFAEIAISNTGSTPVYLNVYNNLIGIPVSGTYPTGCPTTWTEPSTGLPLTHGYGFFAIQSAWTTPLFVGEFAFNTISMASTTRDAYGIAMECDIAGAGPQWDASFNTITQVSGRGILAADWNTSTDNGCGGANIHDNTISVKEAANEGFSLGDAVAIQLRFGEHNSNIYNNTITVPVGTGQCPAQFQTDLGSNCQGMGIKMMSVDAQGNGGFVGGGSSGIPFNNKAFNNTITATCTGSGCVSGSGPMALATLGDFVTDPASYFANNTISTNSVAFAASSSDGCGQGWSYFGNNVTGLTTPTAAFATFGVGPCYTSSTSTITGYIFQDNTYSGSAALDNVGSVYSGTPFATYGYLDKWTYTVTVLNGSTPVPGVTVTAVSTGAGQETVTGVTNSSGVVALSLTQHGGSGTSSAGTDIPNITAYTPHNVTISGAGCSNSTTVTITAKTSANIGCNSSISLTISPSPVAFGAQALTTTSGIMTVTVSNSGSGTVTLGSPYFTLSGTNAADFSVCSSVSGSCSAVGTCVNNASLTVGTSCTLTLIFSPSLAGSENALLTINGSSSASASVTGSGAVSNFLSGSGTIVGSGTIKP